MAPESPNLVPACIFDMFSIVWVQKSNFGIFFEGNLCCGSLTRASSLVQMITAIRYGRFIWVCGLCRVYQPHKFLERG